MLVLFLEGLLVGHWYQPSESIWDVRLDWQSVNRWHINALNAGWVFPPLERR